jgi:ribosomal protein S18 acetylase RimI-like enzyme
VKIRDLRASDAGWVLEFIRRQFPEEEEILGTRISGGIEVVRRLFRWDARIALGLLRLFGRPVFRFFVGEEDRRPMATTLLTFPGPTGYISLVAVDPTFRRHGHARALLERARTTAVARGQRFLVLDVLELNAPARELYASIGYRELRRCSYFVLEPPRLPTPGAPAVPGVRAFQRSDAARLAEIAQAEKPSAVREVLPTGPRDIVGSEWEGKLLSVSSGAWVVDDGSGPSAWVAAVASRATDSAHLSAPIVGPGVSPAAAEGLISTAVAWCAVRRPPRVITLIPGESHRARAALEAVGFRDVLPLRTLYRTSS